MKPIEQAAKEYAERFTIKAGADRTKRENAFKAGVEFSQKWTSTIEGHPDGYYWVLVKNEIGIVEIAAYNEKDKCWEFKNKQHTKFLVWYWRHIKLK